MSKHTPPPWALKTFDDGAFIITEGTDTDDLKYCVIASRNEHDRPEESIANARLIASAPKMYEFIEFVARVSHESCIPSVKKRAIEFLEQIDNPKD